MQFRHPVLDQRLCLKVRRRGGCWQLRGNLGRWVVRAENVPWILQDREAGPSGWGQAEPGAEGQRRWSPLAVWREAVSESIQWDDGGQRKTLAGLCPLWVRRSIEAVEVELRYLPPYSPDLNPHREGVVSGKMKALARKEGNHTVAVLEDFLGNAVDCYSHEECANDDHLRIRYNHVATALPSHSAGSRESRNGFQVDATKENTSWRLEGPENRRVAWRPCDRPATTER